MYQIPAGRRIFLVYVAMLLSLGGLARDDFDYSRVGGVEAIWKGEFGDPDADVDAVESSHESIADVHAIQEALDIAHRRQGGDGPVEGRVEVEEPRSFYLVVQAYHAMPEESRAGDRVGSYVRYEGEVYLVRIDEGIL